MTRPRTSLVYLVGAITNGGLATPQEIEAHIAFAGEVSKALWQRGFGVICPHWNTAWHHQIGGVDHDAYMVGGLEMLRRCDAVVFLPNWVDSEGAREERHFCQAQGLPLYDYPHLPTLTDIERRVA